MWHSLQRLLQHRVLIQTLVMRELKARYRGSALGFLWSFVHPLMLLGVYTFVFTYVFQPARGDDVDPYALYLFCGLLPWTWFSSGLSRAPTANTRGWSRSATTTPRAARVRATCA